MTYGSKVWIFPDAELPPEGVNSIPGHESIIITNVSDEDAYIKITLLYTDKEPVSDLEICVKARRVRCLRTNEEKDFGKYTAEFGEQYAIMLESNTPVVAHFIQRQDIQFKKEIRRIVKCQIMVKFLFRITSIRRELQERQKYYREKSWMQ